MSELKLFWVGSPFIVTVGDGVSVPEILQILRITSMGGCRHDEKVLARVKPETGPRQFFNCHRYGLYEENEGVTWAKVMEFIRESRSVMTYEAGLRWFLSSPLTHTERQKRRIAVLPAEPMIVNGFPQALMFGIITDGPYICMMGVRPDDPFPRDWDFLVADTIEPNPYCQ